MKPKNRRNNNKLVKFSAGKSGDEQYDFEYGSIFETQENYLKIAASKNQIELIIKLLDNLEPPFYILYVLVVSRAGKESGRYQSPIFEIRKKIEEFLHEYQAFIETDGRHHVWIGTINNSGLLAYDHHNVIYAYGPLSKFNITLEKLGFENRELVFPFPHSHSFHEENDHYEDKMVKQFDWKIFPLQEQDEY